MAKFPYIHYRYPNSDGVETILVRLAGDRKILMTIRDDMPPEKDMVIFCDPQKLAPVMKAINGNRSESNPYLIRRHAHAREGIESARTNAKTINPLPMGSAVMLWDKVRFGDGITRTTELIYQQAEFVPLQVPRRYVFIMHSKFGIEDMPPQPAESYIIPRKIGTVWLSDEARGDINRYKVIALMCSPSQL